MYKKCPFCGSDPIIESNTKVFTAICDKCKQNGITLQINAISEKELMDKWNTRTAFLCKKACEDELGKVTYGDLILPNGDKIICDADHKYELLDYLGIESELVANLDYEVLCRDLGIVRISAYLTWVSIDLPHKLTKIQLDKVIELVYNYSTLHSFGIFYKGREIKCTSTEDCVMELDRIRI